MDTWKRYGKAMLAYAQTRPAAMVGYLKDNFRLTDTQAEEYFGEAMGKF